MMPSSRNLTPLITIPGGSAWLGSDEFYPEEAPSTLVHVETFQIEQHPVTNKQFFDFVSSTGWVTTAEQPIPEEIPHLPDELRAPGSLVFTGTVGPVGLDRWDRWWSWVPGANWRQPFGPGSDIADKLDHPVVQISYEDATAYAAWANRRLPSETEWEFAVTNADHPYAWGTEFQPEGQLMANTFQGDFPFRNTGAKGWVGTSPVGTFPATKHNLLDMIGNVWEWTSSEFTASHTSAANCCGARASEEQSIELNAMVVKGGSHLCNPAYCARYRPAARQPQTPDSATTHLGFRCAM